MYGAAAMVVEALLIWWFSSHFERRLNWTMYIPARNQSTRSSHSLASDLLSCAEANELFVSRDRLFCRPGAPGSIFYLGLGFLFSASSALSHFSSPFLSTFNSQLSTTPLSPNTPLPAKSPTQFVNESQPQAGPTSTAVPSPIPQSYAPQSPAFAR